MLTKEKVTELSNNQELIDDIRKYGKLTEEELKAVPEEEFVKLFEKYGLNYEDAIKFGEKAALCETEEDGLALLKECGLDFDLWEDYTAFMEQCAPDIELSDEELDNVQGGRLLTVGFCFGKGWIDTEDGSNYSSDCYCIFFGWDNTRYL